MEKMAPLGGIQRTKESSIGAVVDVASGLKKVVAPNKNKGESRLKGIGQTAEGVFNALDLIPSAVADGTRAVLGPKTQNTTEHNYNVSRALGSFKQIEEPQHVISAAVDTIHAIGFRAGTDIARLLSGRGNSSNYSQSA